MLRHRDQTSSKYYNEIPCVLAKSLMTKYQKNPKCRQGEWYAAVCYSTPAAKPIKPRGCIGVDRNSVGNVAVLADPQNGKVNILGVSAASFKYNFRRRKARLLSQKRRRQAAKLRKKQSRRTTYENHRPAGPIGGPLSGKEVA